VHFIMPEGKEPGTLPKPSDEDVRLLRIEAKRHAAIRFSGRADDRLIKANESRLRSWLDEYGYTAVGPAVYAYYDDPFTPGMFRRNEVLFEVQR
jgi:effector-binding domain-containing protein